MKTVQFYKKYCMPRHESTNLFIPPDENAPGEARLPTSENGREAFADEQPVRRRISGSLHYIM
jgi:hypothetical protein